MTKKHLLGSSILLFLLFLCLGTMIVGAWVVFLVGRGATMSETQEYVVKGPFTHMTVTNPVGEVKIQPVTTKGAFSVHVRKRVRDSWLGDRSKMRRVLDTMRVDVEESNGELRIRVQRPPMADTLRSVSVDLLISVPAHIDIDLTQEVGEITVEEVTGVLHIKDGVGSITLDQVTLLSGSTVDVDTGNIRFSGRLPDTGTVRLATGVGSITMALSPENAFALQTSTGVGHIKVKLPTKTYDSKGSLQLEVGKAPTATLVAQTETGSIDIEVKQ